MIVCGVCICTLTTRPFSPLLLSTVGNPSEPGIRGAAIGRRLRRDDSMSVYVCKKKKIYIYIHAYIHAYVCMYFVCFYIDTYVCVYIYIYRGIYTPRSVERAYTPDGLDSNSGAVAFFVTARKALRSETATAAGAPFNACQLSAERWICQPTTDTSIAICELGRNRTGLEQRRRKGKNCSTHHGCM